MGRAGVAVVLMAAGVFPLAAHAQSNDDAAATKAADDALAKKLANPVAALISVPFQENLDFGIGPNDAIHSTLNIQPVVPFSIGQDWNLITRNILPIVYAEAPAPGASDAFGLSDLVSSFFFSPKIPVNGITWGVGPVFLIPTATENSLGSRKWGAGPTGVVLRQDGPWTYGLLANQIWSFAGDDERSDVNATFIQPFVSYTTADAWTYTLNSETAYDWTNDLGTVPINAILSKLVDVSGQKVSLFGGARAYAAKPDGSPDWGLRFGVTLLFPK